MDAPRTCSPTALIERAKIHDARAICDMVNHFADNAAVLPRTMGQVLSQIRDFTVARVDGRFAGCVALHIDMENLAEIRSLAVGEAFHGLGLGKRLTLAAIDDARALGVARVYALTYIPAFFTKLGFYVISRDDLPQKVWGDCVNCPHFFDCQEVAVMRDLSDTP